MVGEPQMIDPTLRRAAGLRPIVVPVVASAVLSGGIAVTEALALAGLAGLLTGSPGGGLIRAAWLARPWAVLVFAGLALGLNAANLALTSSVAAHWSADRRRELVDAFRNTSFSEQGRASVGLMTSVLEQVVTATRSITTSVGLVGTLVRAVIYLATAFLVSWPTALISVVAGAALMAGLRLLAGYTRGLNRQMSQRSVDLGEAFGELTSNGRELHLLNRWEDAVADIDTHVSEVRRILFVAQTASGMVAPIFFEGIILVGVAVALWGGVGSAPTAEVATSGILLLRAMGALQTIQLTYHQYNDARPYLDKVLSVVSSLRSARQAAGPVVGVQGRSVTARRLAVGHGNGAVLRDVDLELSSPGGVGLVGPSGAGKSSLLLTLAGLLAPAEGEVRLDGVPLDEIPGVQLGAHLGYLPQDPRVLRGTLRSNLVRGGIDIPDAHLLEVLDGLGLSPTVAEFGRGLDTPMGRDGQGFSGGELQRLGLARLIVNDPGVWLLDEPTSALDRRSAELVERRIEAAMEDHIVVLVTHRPELLAACRELVVVEEGRVVDRGSPADVAARHPFVVQMTGGSVP